MEAWYVSGTSVIDRSSDQVHSLYCLHDISPDFVLYPLLRLFDLIVVGIDSRLNLIMNLLNLLNCLMLYYYA